MLRLPETHPDVHQKFEEGYHVARRRDKLWAGLSTDLVIEQALMRSVKKSRSLRSGEGMTVNQA